LSSQWSPSFWLSHQHPICIPPLPHSCCMPCPSRPPWPASLNNQPYKNINKKCVRRRPWAWSSRSDIIFHSSSEYESESSQIKSTITGDRLHFWPLLYKLPCSLEWLIQNKRNLFQWRTFIPI
jgi:hypothetical protein